MPPLISTIMAVSNGQRYLAASITSILNQTCPDFELIIINDASQDHSPAIIQKFAQHDRRIRIFNNKKNRGLTACLNQGLQNAQGKYIARQDADDLSAPERLALQSKFLTKHPEVMLLGSSAEIISTQGKKLKTYYRKNNPQKIARQLKRFNPLFHSSIMFRNSGLTYRPKFYFAQDYDLYLRLLSRNLKITNLPSLLLQNRQHPESITKKYSRAQKLFARQARLFYRQRQRYGSDRYASFNPQEILHNG